MHMADKIGTDQDWNTLITPATVAAAVAIGRDYLLPHALAAFNLMGADRRVTAAKVLWDAIVRRYSKDREASPGADLLVAKSELHQWCATGLHQGRRHATRDCLCSLSTATCAMCQEVGNPAGATLRQSTRSGQPRLAAARERAEPRTDCSDCTFLR